MKQPVCIKEKERERERERKESERQIEKFEQQDRDNFLYTKKGDQLHFQSID